MSTENIPGLEELEELLGRAGAAAAARRGKLRKEQDGRVRHERNLAIGAAASIQRSRDKRAQLDEEDAQLDEIERRAARLLDDVKEPEEEPLAPPEPEPEPAPLTPPTGWNGEEDENPPEEPDDDGEEDATHVVVPVTPHVIDVRHWSMLQWLLAFAGLIVGLVVASATAGLDDLSGAGHGWFTFGWYLAVSGVGFFGGGLIGALIERRRQA
ncbi:hypothetical protein DYH10_03700 [Candidatus Saccharibacteria bacterium CPR2]|nr:hypothetical protein [Candidatus Saccharibacteria bacterium CPR2]